MKVVGIVEDNPITGVRYGLVEAADYIKDATNRNAEREYTKMQEKKRAISAKKFNNTKNK